MRFDWYQATVPEDDPNTVIEALWGLTEGAQLRGARGMHGYAQTARLEAADGLVAQVWHGGTHVYPHIVVSGEHAQGAAELIRVRWPQHWVSRVDPCIDFGDAGAFDRIQAVMLDAAQQHRVRVDTRGDHLLTKQGRTLYLGAPSSAVRQRLYDKAAELRAQFAADPVRLAQVPEHLTRLEAQVRPATREAREAFASIEPAAAMGSSRWLREVMRHVAGLELEPVQAGTVYRQSDDARAWAYLLAQYGPLLRRVRGDLGSWECVGLQIGADLAERDKARAAPSPS